MAMAQWMLPYETTAPNKFLPVKNIDLSYPTPVFYHCLELISTSGCLIHSFDCLCELGSGIKLGSSTNFNQCTLKSYENSF